MLKKRRAAIKADYKAKMKKATASAKAVASKAKGSLGKDLKEERAALKELRKREANHMKRMAKLLLTLQVRDAFGLLRETTSHPSSQAH